MIHKSCCCKKKPKAIKRRETMARAVARTEMGGFWTNRFVENGFYLKRVSLGLGNLENGLEPGITRVNLKWA
jgi:hypothetical protein